LKIACGGRIDFANLVKLDQWMAAIRVETLGMVPVMRWLGFFLRLVTIVTIGRSFTIKRFG
jgi:hypothetical protein